MKKSHIFRLLIICVIPLLIFGSCSSESETTGPDLYPVTSIVGLIKDYRIVQAGGSYDGESLENLDTEQSVISVYRGTGRSIWLEFLTIWTNGTYELKSQIFEIDGDADNIIFDRNIYGRVTVNNSQDYAEVAISGWIKLVSEPAETNQRPDFTCDIKMICSISGNELAIEIREIMK